MNTKKWLIIGAGVLALAVVFFGTDWFSAGKPVETQRAAVGSIHEFIDEQGKTRLPQTYLITMPITGRIEAIGLVEGMQVRKGEAVARIVPYDLELSVAEAKAAVERLEASLAENADASVEETSYQQALQFVKSTAATVLAAAERMTAGKARLDYAERDLGRVRQLAASGARTQDELERAALEQVQSDVNYKQDRLVYAAMQAMAAATDLMPVMVRQYIQRKKLSGAVLQKQKAEAVARLDQVLRDQRRGAMLSPVDGVVLDRPVSNERYLSAGTTLLEIGRLEDLEVEADVLSLDVVAAKVGDPAEIYGPAIGRTPARGTVARVFPAGFTKVSSLGVEQQRVKVIIHFEPGELRRLLEEQRLGVGYHLRVKIFTADKTEALLVPRSALFRAADNSWHMFVVRGGRARLQTVKVGLINDEQVEITDGIAAGEPVILAPESNLTDGVKVRAVGR